MTRRWTEKELSTLRSLYQAGRPVSSIADLLHRSPQSIRQQASRLDVSRRHAREDARKVLADFVFMLKSDLGVGGAETGYHPVTDPVKEFAGALQCDDELWGEVLNCSFCGREVLRKEAPRGYCRGCESDALELPERLARRLTDVPGEAELSETTLTTDSPRNSTQGRENASGETPGIEPRPVIVGDGPRLVYNYGSCPDCGASPPQYPRSSARRSAAGGVRDPGHARKLSDASLDPRDGTLGDAQRAESLPQIAANTVLGEQLPSLRLQEVLEADGDRSLLPPEEEAIHFPDRRVCIQDAVYHAEAVHVCQVYKTKSQVGACGRPPVLPAMLACTEPRRWVSRPILTKAGTGRPCLLIS